MRRGMPRDPDAWEPDQHTLHEYEREAELPFEPSEEDFRAMGEQQARDAEARAMLHLTRLRARLRAVAIARCPRGDGRILFGVYPFEGRLWLWQEGRRRPPGRFAWPDDPLHWEAVEEGVVDFDYAKRLHDQWQDAMEYNAIDGPGFGANPPYPPDDVFEPAPPAVHDLGPMASPDGGRYARLASAIYPIVTCPRCRTDYTPGSVTSVLDVVRRSVDRKQPGVILVTAITSVYDIPLPPGHRLLNEITQHPNYAWVHSTDKPVPETPLDRLRRRREDLERLEQDDAYWREHGDEEDWLRRRPR